MDATAGNMNGNNQEIFLNNKNVDDFVKDIIGSVRDCQKLSTELAGWHHYRDYVGVERTIDHVNNILMSLVSNIFKHQDIRIGLSRRKLIDMFDVVREGNDALLERINSDIDEASGLKKNADAEFLDPVGFKKVEGPTSTPSRNVVLLASRNVQKPQLFFVEKVDNSHKKPFIPLLKEKPNNKKPLSILLCLSEDGTEYYNHPYEYELQHWNPELSQLDPTSPQLPNPVTNTPIVMVETEEDLVKMVSELKNFKEFGFDLEHHSYRSYQGLTCLMQISTREIDYIVDPIALRGKLTILNEVFTDPKITKVAHGADHDVLWLQRDCGVYIVNLFDTHQAAVVLEYPHRSLAALLTKFCGIEANKVYQRADWRIRPLPEDFVNYARQDSHSLLYIYDLMRNELIEKGNKLNNLITAVYDRSREICMKRYDKPAVGPDSHMDIYRRSRKTFNSRQMFALQALFLWRDRVAREQDESTEYVLPKHMLLQIAEVLPKEMQGILACCNPIPPLVKSELLTLHTLIREARQQPLTDVQTVSLENPLPLLASQTSDDLHTHLICKHDLSECEENPTDLPVLLKPGDNLLGDLFVQHRIPVVSRDTSVMFGCSKNDIENKTKSLFEISEEFTSPYERYVTYLEMKPFIEGEKKKGADQDRIKRIMDHFKTLTANTNTDLEAEVEARLRAFRNEQQDTESRAEVNQEEQTFVSVVEEPQEMIKSVERQLTHQAIDSFLESARMTTENKSDADHVGQMLSHFRSLTAPIPAQVSDSSSNDSVDAVPKEEPTKKKKKKKGVKVVLGDEVKMKKHKGKTAKRKSSEALAEESSSKKMKSAKEESDDGEKEEEMEDEGEEGELSSSSSGEASKPSTFDYESADYSVFQKKARKTLHKTNIKQKFKGKKPKKIAGTFDVKSKA